ncbi:MAG TPA: hypothetical protein VK279_12465 [Solirubrobacteraceae bacterium]|nr:hypothetical protein [Solirubrobacteraceae bacterium]
MSVDVELERESLAGGPGEGRQRLLGLDGHAYHVGAAAMGDHGGRGEGAGWGEQEDDGEREGDRKAGHVL